MMNIVIYKFLYLRFFENWFVRDGIIGIKSMIIIKSFDVNY